MAGTYALLPRDPPGKSVIRCDVGEPTDPPPAFVSDRLIESVPGSRGYPPTAGIPALRTAAADWLRRRFSVSVHPDREVLATQGSKEAIFHLPLVLADRESRPRVLYPEPGYPVYRLGALYAGCVPTPYRVSERTGYGPVWDELPPSLLSETSILWLNYPHNPSGAGARREIYSRAVALAQRYGFWLASDEAYVDLHRSDGEPPPSALSIDKACVLALHTLSKRSSMASHRTGFVAGDAGAIDALRRARPSFGVASPTFIQEAAARAWADDGHVAAARASYTRRWDTLAGAASAAGLEAYRGATPFFLWCKVPSSDTEKHWLEHLERAGVTAVAGSDLGAAGYIRFAATPSEADCAEAAERIRAAHR